jgi:hypothetical protein
MRISLLSVAKSFLVPLAVLASCTSTQQSPENVGQSGVADQSALAAVRRQPFVSVCGRVRAGGGTNRCYAKVRVDDSGSVVTDVAPSGFGALDLRSAYSLPSSGANGKTVAVVVAYDTPTAESDLAAYRAQYGLPPCTTANGCFQKVAQDGSSNLPPVSPAGDDWSTETALDIEMVSAACSDCKILVVEANSDADDMYTAVSQAAKMSPFAISVSWGGPEGSGEIAAFNQPGILITASAGDNGYGVEYPATSQYVLSVGGTTLVQSSSTSRGWVEGAWSGGGSGCSAVITKPSWQTDTGCAMRTTADVSAVADPNTGVAVYSKGSWMVVGGTSAASALVAGAYTLLGVGGNAASFTWTHPSDFFDVTTGHNGTCSTGYLCTAGAGYDGPTGWGTPNGAAFTNGTGSGSGSMSSGSGSGSGGQTSCAHSECAMGTKLVSSCDPCVATICAQDAFCCNTKWDSICVGESASVCGESCSGGGSSSSSGSGGESTCAHAECATGTKLVSGCDPCATKICSTDPYCCSTAWDSICVGEVTSVCGDSCTGTSTCSHADCSTGGKLVSNCDPCVAEVCAKDPYCCSTAWDSICVGEVGSVCGKPCTAAGGTCAHPVCASGSPLTASCGSCATALCASDPYCCSVAWDNICVGEVKTYCAGQTCP